MNRKSVNHAAVFVRLGRSMFRRHLRVAVEDRLCICRARTESIPGFEFE